MFWVRGKKGPALRSAASPTAVEKGPDCHGVSVLRPRETIEVSLGGCTEFQRKAAEWTQNNTSARQRDFHHSHSRSLNLSDLYRVRPRTDHRTNALDQNAGRTLRPRRLHFAGLRAVSTQHAETIVGGPLGHCQLLMDRCRHTR